MGDYTACFGRLKLKEDVSKEILTIDNGNIIIDWDYLKRVRRLRRHPDILIFLSNVRASQIAMGASAYHSLNEYSHTYNCSGSDILIGLSGESDRKYNTRTRELRFFCSLKDYADTIDAFASILHLIAYEFDVWKKFEDDSPLVFIKTTHPGVTVRWILSNYLRERSNLYGFI